MSSYVHKVGSFHLSRVNESVIFSSLSSLSSLLFLLSHTSGKSVIEATENRNYLASRMTDEINEIIRVLQLTTYDEDEWDADNLTCMKKAQVSD